MYFAYLQRNNMLLQATQQKINTSIWNIMPLDNSLWLMVCIYIKVVLMYVLKIKDVTTQIIL